MRKEALPSTSIFAGSFVVEEEELGLSSAQLIVKTCHVVQFEVGEAAVGFGAQEQQQHR